MLCRHFASFSRWRAPPVKRLPWLVLVGLCGCAGRHPLDPAVDLGSSFRVTTIPGNQFAITVAVPRDQQSAATLWVFLEGDGRPWLDRGTHIADDPSPINAIGFELFKSSPLPRAYLGRPCYFGHARDTGCEPSLWTSARYGEAVVASMAAALETLVRESSTLHVILVGFSGGGPIAYLIAPRVPQVAAVVTIAGNLDTDAWTGLHRFLPLSGSGNPATQPALDRRITQIAVIAGRDTNVPVSSLQMFLARQRPQEVWVYDANDHACCWRRDWPSILTRIRARLD